MAELFGSITSQDMINAQKYATNKLLREKVLAYTPAGAIAFKPSTQSGNVSYRCPEGLTCYEGMAVIATQDECQSRNFYDKNTNPNPVPGWPLYWSTDDNQCHFSNYGLHQLCDTLPKKGNLDWDDTSQTCYTTRSYCEENGYDAYNPPSKPTNPTNPDDGGSCGLSPGMTVAQALFGNTIARGVFGGACFHN